MQLTALLQKNLRKIAAGVGLALLTACHASPDDAAGQAKELGDAKRREYAIGNITRLYTKALSDSGGDPKAAGPKKIADATQAELTKTYLEIDDVKTGLQIIGLLHEMRDERTLPALVKALDWQSEVNEEHAIRACRTVSKLELPPDARKRAVQAVEHALEKVKRSRTIDNRIRVDCIRTLGSLADASAGPILTRIMLSHNEEQNFLINRLAAEQLGRLRDPQNVPMLVKAMFIYSARNPLDRMTDVAVEGLVRSGKAAVKPLIDVLAGKNDDVNGIVDAYIRALGKKDPKAAKDMDKRTLTASEASFALGQIGFQEAFEPLLQETRVANSERQTAAALALAWLSWAVSDRGTIQKTLESIYQKTDKVGKPPLILTMQHMFYEGSLPFFLAEARREEDELPDIRFIAAQAYALLANKEEAEQLRPVLTREPQGEEADYRNVFKKNIPMLDLARTCDSDLKCWVAKINDPDLNTARKAIHMAVRYGRGQASVVDALVASLQKGSPKLRSDVLYALDQASIKGSKPAVAAIEELATREEGSAEWNQIKSLAMAVQARLTGRGQ